MGVGSRERARIPRVPPATPRRAAIAFIFVTVVLDVLSMGIVIPVLPKLVETFEGGDTARAAQIYGWFGTAWALMQFIFMPVIGALSDRFGRRPVVLVSCFGLGCDYFLMALAPDLTWLFVGRVISGITAASFGTAFAYIADVAPPEKRAASFGMVGAAFGLGFVLGPALGGILGEVSPRLPFWVAGALALANAAYGFFVLPESLAKDKRSAFSWRKANPVGSLTLLRSHPELSGLAVSNFLMQLAHVVLPSVTVLYMGYRYGWDTLHVGLTLAGVGVASMVVQGALVKPAVARLEPFRRNNLDSSREPVDADFVADAEARQRDGAAAGHAGCEELDRRSGRPLIAARGEQQQQGLTLFADARQQKALGDQASVRSCLKAFLAQLRPGDYFAQLAFIGPRADLHLPGAPFLLAALLIAAACAIAWAATAPRHPPPA